LQEEHNDGDPPEGEYDGADKGETKPVDDGMHKSDPEERNGAERGRGVSLAGDMGDQNERGERRETLDRI